MRRSRPTCGHHWAWALADGRFKCRGCQTRYTYTRAWSSSRLSEATERRLVDYLVLGLPAYRLRFHHLASAPMIERFYRVMRQVMSQVEELTTPFECVIDCDETMFGSYRRGKRGWE